MKILVTIFIVVLTFNSYSQTTSELELNKIKYVTKLDSLENKRDNLEKDINDIRKKIDSINKEIGFSKIRNTSLSTTTKRDSRVLLKPYSTSKVIGTISKNDQVLVIDYYEYGDYYKVFYKNQIVYVAENDIRKTKEIKSLKYKTSNKQSIYNRSSITPNKSSRKANYRTYYKGPRGGCYYINSNGNKTYVSRSLCN